MEIFSLYGILNHYFNESLQYFFDRVSRERRIFTNNGNASGWASVPFRHPSTFQTLALEPELKKQITEELTAFLKEKELYHRVGCAWTRGYILHGPTGSGKSSLIAAMSNLLCYDVYDVVLTKDSNNSELRALLTRTTNRSIVVIKGMDRYVDLTAEKCPRIDGGDESGGVTLSGLLDFTDGLWSCCFEERIIVFTMNKSLDPAQVRCVRVSLGKCGMHEYKVLAMRARMSGGDRREPTVEEHDDGAKTPESMDRTLMESPANKESSPGKSWSVGFEGRMGGMGKGCGRKRKEKGRRVNEQGCQ